MNDIVLSWLWLTTVIIQYDEKIAYYLVYFFTSLSHPLSSPRFSSPLPFRIRPLRSYIPDHDPQDPTVDRKER